MKSFPKGLKLKLKQRIDSNSLRNLGLSNELVDFSSNDYLGFATNEFIFDKTHHFLIDKNLKVNGATGSRLLSGNHNLYAEVETFLAKFHNTETALIFNAGYDANLGFFSSVPQRGDVVVYDEFIHASIRDGIRLSNAKAFKFKHNDLANLNEILKRIEGDNNTIYVVTESIFSMDGDTPNLNAIVKLCKKHNAFLVVDEAHAVGVFKGGLVQKLNLENEVFARIVTFGKALGCHGAAILGAKNLQQYIVNYARSFIYTTGLSPHSLATIKTSYDELETTNEIAKLQENIWHFKTEIERLNLNFIESKSSIHCCVIGGNLKTKKIANQLQENGFDVKPILSPTIREGEERLRFCLHSYNTFKEITSVLELLSKYLHHN